MSDNIDNMVDDLISQLQSDQKSVLSTKEVDQLTPTTENLEEYVIKKSSALVEGTIDMVETVKDYIVSAPESKDVSSLSELINAATNAVETLNKIVLSQKKNKTLLQIKEMDIASKRDLQENENTNKLKLTREEVFKMILNNTKPVEGEIVESKQIEDRN